MKWHKAVYLLVRLYAKTIRIAIGERIRVRRFMKAVVIMKRDALIITNIVAARMLIIPRGISPSFVLGLRASNRLSAILLNPIAALRAKIMQSIIRRKSLRLKLYSLCDTASEKPISANGIAKTV